MLPLSLAIEDAPVEMSLSDAMLAGAILRPQAFGKAWARGLDGALGSDAIGAIYEGAFGEMCSVSELSDRLLARFPVLASDARIDPPCGCKPDTKWKRDDQGIEVKVTVYRDLWDCLVHLNDKHRWTRENIAVWLKEKGL